MARDAVGPRGRTFRWEVSLIGLVIVGTGVAVQFLAPLPQSIRDTLGGSLYGMGATLFLTELIMVKERRDAQRNHSEVCEQLDRVLSENENLRTSIAGVGSNSRNLAFRLGVQFIGALMILPSNRLARLEAVHVLAGELDIKDVVDEQLNSSKDLRVACEIVGDALNKKGERLAAAFALGCFTTWAYCASTPHEVAALGDQILKALTDFGVQHDVYEWAERNLGRVEKASLENAKLFIKALSYFLRVMDFDQRESVKRLRALMKSGPLVDDREFAERAAEVIGSFDEG